MRGGLAAATKTAHVIAKTTQLANILHLHWAMPRVPGPGSIAITTLTDASSLGLTVRVTIRAHFQRRYGAEPVMAF